MYKNYRIVKEEAIQAVDGQGILLEHVKTGARVLVISNSDDNKVFNITFRTPPADDTGLPHILEHSVLCGSRKFPVKDPFVELAKGSLNTFLNAMTYSDKTMYPVASCNDKDFNNLMDVYLDAVFYPNIYNDPRILQQEGWHYEMEDVDGEVIYNGVVYNEMKGASSSPEQVLFRQIQGALFPNHPYGMDSGGEPEAIPDLTDQQFLSFHKEYYHPSNSFIYLYGDLDVAEKLQWLDEAYLSEFQRIEIDSSLKEVKAFESKVYVQKPYAISSDSTGDKKTYLSYNVAFNQPEDYWTNTGLEILEYLLLEAPGAPLKAALLDLGIAEDIFGSFDSGINQPTFSIIAKNANGEDEGLFVDTIEEVLKKVAADGFDQRRIEAAINFFEFKLREGDYGQYPKGIIYGIKALDTWLYDRDPFVNFYYDEVFDALRKGVKTGLLETLIHKYILNNSHCAILQLVPDGGLLEEKEAKLKDKLQAYKASLSQADKESLVESTQALKHFQETPNTQEELATIPLLEKSDINPSANPVTYELEKEGEVTYVLHTTFTNNIVYGKLLFDFSELTMEDVPYVGLLGRLMTKINTENYSYSALSDEINIYTGGIKANTNVYGVNNNPDECQLRLELKFKCFSQKINETMKLVEEIVTGTIFEDTKRINELISENRSRLSMSLMSSGHTVAMGRSMSYHNLPGKYRDLLDGIGYFRFLEGIKEPAALEAVIESLKRVAKKVLVKNHLTVTLNTEASLLATSKKAVDQCLQALPVNETQEEVEESLNFESLNEGFKSSSKVQYNALTGDYVAEGYTYTGHMKVLQTIMSLDYMWTEIRIKGGAYGGFGGFRRSGVFYLGSYRDPNLKKTYEIYDQLPAYVRGLAMDDREMTKYIIGTISQLDTPMTPSMRGDKALNMYMSQITSEDLQRERDEVLSTDIEALKPLGDVIERVIAQNHICVIGNETVVEGEHDFLGEIKQLFQ